MAEEEVPSYPATSRVFPSSRHVDVDLREKNPFAEKMTIKFNVPRDAAISRPKTLYPEYRKKMSLPK